MELLNVCADPNLFKDVNASIRDEVDLDHAIINPNYKNEFCNRLDSPFSADSFIYNQHSELAEIINSTYREFKPFFTSITSYIKPLKNVYDHFASEENKRQQLKAEIIHLIDEFSCRPVPTIEDTGNYLFEIENRMIRLNDKAVSFIVMYRVITEYVNLALTNEENAFHLKNKNKISYLSTIFARYYFESLREHIEGKPVTDPAWREFFEYTKKPEASFYVAAVIGMYIHIKKDLPRGIVIQQRDASILDDDQKVISFYIDHLLINGVLSESSAPACEELIRVKDKLKTENNEADRADKALDVLFKSPLYSQHNINQVTSATLQLVTLYREEALKQAIYFRNYLTKKVYSKRETTICKDAEKRLSLDVAKNVKDFLHSINKISSFFKIPDWLLNGKS